MVIVVVVLVLVELEFDGYGSYVFGDFGKDIYYGVSDGDYVGVVIFVGLFIFSFGIFIFFLYFVEFFFLFIKLFF